MQKLVSEQRVIALVLLLLTVGLIVSTFGLQFADLGGAFSPMFFPRIILGILLVLAAINLIVDMMHSPKPQDIRLLPTLVICASFVVYALLVMPLGFFISSVLMALVLLITLGVRDLRALVLLPVGAAGSLVLLFNHILKMPLPSSPFFWWI